MAKRNCKPNLPTALKANGQKLAAAMLREFGQVNADEVSIEARYHPGKPQRDILSSYLRHLHVVRQPNVRHFSAGFYAVLNDFLANALGGAGVMEPEFYERLNDAEIGRESTAEEKGEYEATPITRRRHLTLVYSRN